MDLQIEAAMMTAPLEVSHFDHKSSSYKRASSQTVRITNKRPRNNDCQGNDHPSSKCVPIVLNEKQIMHKFPNSSTTNHKGDTSSGYEIKNVGSDSDFITKNSLVRAKEYINSNPHIVKQHSDSVLKNLLVSGCDVGAGYLCILPPTPHLEKI